MNPNEELLNSLETLNIQRDTTSYAGKFLPSLNEVLNAFSGSECLMVRKIKEKFKLKSTQRNCHSNVSAYIKKFGGQSISGWILNRSNVYSDRGMYVWSFHSVWEKPDGKWIDVTEDKHYIGRDKSIFLPDTQRKPDMENGISYNNFIVFTDSDYVRRHGESIGVMLKKNKIYWTDTTMVRMLDTSQHNGMYRLLNKEFPANIKMMCDEYELEIVDGSPIPKPGSKYENAPGFPLKMVFDYSVSTSG